MRVLVAMPFAAALGGSERLLQALLAHPDEHRLDLSLTFLADGPMVGEARALGLPVSVLDVRMPNDPRDAARAAAALRRELRSTRAEVVLSWYARAQLYAAPAALSMRPRPRIVWYQHDVRVRMPLERAASLLFADLVICNSRAALDAQSELRPRRRTALIHPGVDVPVVDPVRAVRWREGLSLPEGATILGIVGRLVAWKGQDRFVRMLAVLRAAGHNVAGVIVGGSAHDLEPDYEPALRGLVAELGLTDRVRFTGHTAEPELAIAGLDVLVNASAAEPFGMTLTEAMALGRPVVAVAAGGPLEIVADGMTGRLARSPQPEDLAAAAAALVTDHGLRTRMGEAGRTRFAAHFTAAAMATRLGDTLRALP